MNTRNADIGVPETETPLQVPAPLTEPARKEPSPKVEPVKEPSHKLVETGSPRAWGFARCVCGDQSRYEEPSYLARYRWFKRHLNDYLDYEKARADEFLEREAS